MIYICHEPWFYLWNSLCPARYSGDEFLRFYFQTFSFRWLRIAPKDVLDGLPQPLARSDLKQGFRKIMRLKAESLGKARYGEKTPAHTKFLGEIFDDFPDARVIVIIRDPRSTVASVRKMPWGSKSDLANCTTFEGMRKNITRFEERILLVRLEDLQSEPEQTMRRVLDFVGEEWSDAVLEHSAHNPDPEDMPDVPWLRQSSRPLVRQEPGPTGIDPARIKVIEMICGRSMKQFDYPRANETDAPGQIQTFARLLSEVPGALSFALTAARRFRALQDPTSWGDSIASYGHVFHGFNPEWESEHANFEFPSAPALIQAPRVTQSEVAS